jgi:hypothetical protein
LRWWFFRPFDGRLFAATAGPPGPTWLLRDGRAVVEVRVRGRWIEARRSASGRSERIEAYGSVAGAAEPGERVRYVDEATGLAVEIFVEALASEAPTAEAFEDPDLSPAHE